MKCPICNGDMLGDGVTSPMHCEFVEVDPWVEPDAPTTFCDAPSSVKPAGFKLDGLRALLKNQYVDDYGTYPDSIMRLLDLYESYDLLLRDSSEADHERMGSAIKDLIESAMYDHNLEQGWKRSVANSWRVAWQTYDCHWRIDLI